MTGDYTKVPLRPEDRWTGARMQQGRVLLDHEWNLNVDAAARAARAAARDVIGPAGVVAGSPDFKVDVTASGALDLNVQPGRIWVDGLLAYAPTGLSYGSQAAVDPLPSSGNAIVYLDVFEEHVQPAEDDSLVDPALRPVDSSARTRVGYRVRVAPTTAVSCKEAWANLTRVAGSTGALSIARTPPAAPSDPCAPPGDPQGQLPDGLFRVEVLDGGDQNGARFAWSYENGGSAVAVASGGIAGAQVTLVPSASVKFENGDRVEVSWLERRADRVAHGALYTVSGPPQAGAGGDVLELDRSVTVPAGVHGIAVRRWNGEAVGAAAATTATFRGDDVGVTFTAGSGNFSVGDWWGARLREEEGVGIEARANAAPDGTRHVFAPLALVDLTARKILHDCRPTFVPLTELDFQAGACTVSVKPGDDLQAALDSIPSGGGELCLAAGVYPLATPLVVKGRRRIVITGAGASTILRATQTEAAIVVDGSEATEIRNVRVEGGGAAQPNLNGAITALDPKGLVVADCSVACQGLQAGRGMTCITVRQNAGAPDDIRIERNTLEIGVWQTGILIVGADHSVVAGNRLVLAPNAKVPDPPTMNELVLRILRHLVAGAIRPQPGQGLSEVVIPGAGQINVVAGAEGTQLIQALAGRITAAQGKREGANPALHRATRRAIGSVSSLPQGVQTMVNLVQQQLLAAWQGIVVGGRRAGTVQILDNVVEGTVQGIHVAVSAGVERGLAADQVMISRNVVHSVVPALYPDERHAVFVGNANSIHVLDTIATLARPGAGSLKAPPTPVDGIHIHGHIGSFLCVRQSSLRGFETGVRVVPVGAIPAGQWLVTGTVAAQGSHGVVAGAPVILEHNVP